MSINTYRNLYNLYFVVVVHLEFVQYICVMWCFRIGANRCLHSIGLCSVDHPRSTQFYFLRGGGGTLLHEIICLLVWPIWSFRPRYLLIHKLWLYLSLFRVQFQVLWVFFSVSGLMYETISGYLISSPPFSQSPPAFLVQGLLMQCIMATL